MVGRGVCQSFFVAGQSTVATRDARRMDLFSDSACRQHFTLFDITALTDEHDRYVVLLFAGCATEQARLFASCSRVINFRCESKTPGGSLNFRVGEKPRQALRKHRRPPNSMCVKSELVRARRHFRLIYGFSSHSLVKCAPGVQWFVSSPFQSNRRSWGDCDQRHKFRCVSERDPINS
jgi:hypothetical protein